MKSKLFYKIILIILILTAVAISTILLFKYISNIENEKQMQFISDELLEKTSNKSQEEKENTNQNNSLNSLKVQKQNNTQNILETKDKSETKIKGYKVIGVIQIPKINLKYPILEINNEETMKISITKFWGNNVNENGNLTLAGHNNLDGTMFGKLKKLKLEDEIKLTDLNKNTKSYKIYNIYITSPEDTSIVNGDNDKSKVTLITCSNGRKQRLIIKAQSEEF